MTKPINIQLKIKETPNHGRFGAIRRFDKHCGVDIYCDEGEIVYAIEEGEVINICNFTGIKAGSEWWNDTKAVLIKGKSGVILYGELDNCVGVGEKLEEGEIVGFVKTVLKENKNLPMCMLHIELYDKDYTGDGEWWKLNEEKPKDLLNIENILIKLYE